MFSAAGSSVRQALILVGLAFAMPLLPTPMVARSEAVPPEPPRVFLDTTLVAPSGQTIAVASGGNFQAALNAAQPGDVITLQAGATFTGPFTLPNKGGAGWITVRTSAPDSSLPAPGTRVNPSYASVMPKLVVGAGVGGAIQSAAGAHHFRFIGIEVRPASGAFVHSLVEFGNGGESSTSAQPHDMIIDRCYIHGNPNEGSRRGVAVNGSRLSVIDSYLSEFKDDFVDTQAIMGWNGPGPIKIVNNYLEAAGENVMFGGSDPSIANLVPSDIEIRHNYFFKPTSWRGVWAAVKNLFELKNARRVLVEGNLFENIWAAAQAGFALQFTIRNQDGGCPWCTIEDVTFRKNIVRHAAAGLNILAKDDPNTSDSMKRVLIEDNLFDDISSSWGGWGRLFQILGWAGGSTDLVIEHNTGFQTENLSYAEGVGHTRFIYRNNLTPRGGGAGFTGGGSSEGITALNAFFPQAIFLRNVLAGGNASIYPAGNYFPSSLGAVGFVNLSGGNYRLAAASPYKNGGSDGTDVGADFDALEAATAGVTSGAPGTSDTSSPTVSMTAPGSGVTVSGTAVMVSASASDNVGVVRVQFRLDGANLGAPVTTPPYAISWNSTTAANGSHTLTAQALDAAGNMGASAARTVTVSNDTTPPTVAISSPTPGQTVSGVVTITASASDSVGVTRIDYLQDGQILGVLSPPVFTFAWITTTVSNGSHSLSVRAYDAVGNVTTSAAVVVTVNNADVTPPTVTITSPTANPTYTTSSSALTLGGTAADNLGVTQVTWRNSLDGSSGMATGTTSWTANGIVLQPGANVLTVTARDAAGNTATDIVTVTLSVPFTFTDDPLVAQSTRNRAVHVMELRTAIDSVRVARGLASFAWTDPTLTLGSTPVRVVHLAELRAALNQAYQAAGRALPTYTDATIVAGLTSIKATHLNELRAAARGL
jgi:hypothetical protein